MKPFSSLKAILAILFVCLIISHKSHAAHVLFMHTCSTFSHRVAEWPLVEGLLAKGHNVTFISPYGPSGAMSNPKVLEIVPISLQKLALGLLADNFDVNHRAYGILPPLFLILDLFCYQTCETALTSPEIQDWLAKGPKVDLVIGDMVTECSTGMAEKLKAKSALFSPIPLVTEHFEYLGISSESASIPDYDVTRPIPLGLLNRMTGALLPLYYLVMDAIYYPWYTTLFKKTLGLDNLPGVYEMRGRIDLLLINGDYISDYARSWPPHVVKVEGIHIKRPEQEKPLPKEIQVFINAKTANGSNNEGFIFISFGTIAKAPSLPIELRKIFFNVIETFPHIQFIWKWDGNNPEEYPKNLLPVPWVDQQDLLAHSKIRAFLTQAGRPSTQEALYHKVPTVTFPILADQDFNAQRSAGLGVSLPLDFVGLSEEKLQKALSEILSNKKFKDRLTQLSSLVKDVPIPPVELGVWWVEFVLRHSKEELDLMKPLGRHLSWYQKRDLDVWMFILIFVITMAYLAFYISKVLLNRFVFSNQSAVTGIEKDELNGSKKGN